MNEFELRQLDWLADLMDTRILIPGTDIGMGLDGVIGLIPGIGDTATLLVSGYILHKARPHVSPVIMSRMIWNVFVDWAVGIIPFFGDIFDVGWKANRKNVDMLKAHILTTKYAHMDDKGQALFI
jgi:hypothetical protein